jgi:hypothetical protein
VGSTACAFGRASGDETALYVTTSGGLLTPFHGEIEDASCSGWTSARPAAAVPGLTVLRSQDAWSSPG